MSLWEYKVITSGKGGFATPALLEKFLNDLGRDEWEIVHFKTPPDNFLAFTGLVRRSTQRDWTLQDAAAAAAKAEAEKLRAEFEAKFKAASSNAPAGLEERAPSFIEEKVAPDDGFRKPVDTSHDDEPESAEDEKDDWDKLTAAEEDELPTFFEAIKPHMRRNQRGPGMSVGVDYLAKKWEQSEEDMRGALEECGFVIPTDEDADVEYLEYDGDLYWLNVNRRGELWINTKEKPRPVFRSVKAQKAVVEETPKPAPAESSSKAEAVRRSEPDSTVERKEEQANGAETSPTQASKPQPAPLPDGAALLDKIRPHMRRNRRGPGGSGSMSFLARALRSNEADLKAAFVGLGLTTPANASDKPAYTEIGNELWWLNVDSRGGLWINGREKRAGETAGNAKEESPPAGSNDVPNVANVAAADASAAPSEPSPREPATTELVSTSRATPELASSDVGAPETPSDAAQAETEMTRELAPVPADSAASAELADSGVREPAAAPIDGVPETVAPAGVNVLAGVRVFLKETRTGALASKIDRIADELGRPAEDVLSTLVVAGLKVPEKPREKHVFVEHEGEVFWLNRNARGELWLNAKPSKSAYKYEAEDEAREGVENGDALRSDEAEGEKKAGRRVGMRARPKKPE